MSKETKEKILDALDETKKTNQIIISIPKGEDGYPLFEKIQNDFNLYDNCVIDTDKNGIQEIRIEGKNLNQVRDLFNKLSKNYTKRIKMVRVLMEDTIIEKGRDEETGGLEV